MISRSFTIWFALFAATLCFGMAIWDMATDRWVWALVQFCLAVGNFVGFWLLSKGKS